MVTLLDPFRRAAGILREGQPAIAFTGAGVSAASGIPTFRATDGIWARFPIEEYGTANAFRTNPERCWELFGPLSHQLEGAEPNPAHLGLARLETLGLLRAVITQNIDGLHQRAGSTRVVEIHGSVETSHCPRCGERHHSAGLPPWPPAPRCSACGAVVKPDVVLFGDPMPGTAMDLAHELMESARAILAVGTSLQVMPASWFVLESARRGTPVILVDPDPSPEARHAATVTLHAPAEEAIPTLLGLLESSETPV